jgi:hypothetical protein
MIFNEREKNLIGHTNHLLKLNRRITRYRYTIRPSIGMVWVR